MLLLSAIYGGTKTAKNQSRFQMSCIWENTLYTLSTRETGFAVNSALDSGFFAPWRLFRVLWATSGGRAKYFKPYCFEIHC